MAIDGKVLRGTLKGGEKQAVIHAISHDTRSEVAQACQSGSKSSEIPIVRQLLKETGLEGKKIGSSVIFVGEFSFKKFIPLNIKEYSLK